MMQMGNKAPLFKLKKKKYSRNEQLAKARALKRDKALRLKCPHDDCDRSFLDQVLVDLHLHNDHKEFVPTICDWENCGKSFETAQAAETHKKSVHYKKAPHKCTKCEKGFNKFEDIKSHFLLTHTKWKKDESSEDNGRTSIPIDKESTSGTDWRSNSFTPNVSENEDSSDDFDFDSFFDKPKLTTKKVEIVFECDRENCGKCFKTSSELESHKKTHVVENDDKLQKCTKCDARFESFELVKTHFLHTHTKWKKEDALDEDKNSKDATVVNEYGSDDCKNMVPKVPKVPKVETKGAAVKKINKNYSKNIQNRKKTDKLFNTVTSESSVEGFASMANDTILNENQSVSNANNTVDKNTYLIFTEEVMLNSENPTFYIIKTKPKVEDSTSNVQDSSLYQQLTQNTASNIKKNITVANFSSSFTQHDMSKAKLAMSYAQNLISDLRKNTSNVENTMPKIGNATSFQANIIPIVRNITPNLANVIPIVRNVTPNLANVVPVVRNNTPNLANVVPVVRNNTPNLANVVPVVRNNTPNLANVIPGVESNSPNLANVRPVVGNIIPNDEDVRKEISTDVVNAKRDGENVTSNVATTKPWVNKSTSMLANIIPVIKNIVPNVPAENITPNFANTTREFGTSTADLKKPIRTYERRNRQSNGIIQLDNAKRKGEFSRIQKCDCCGDKESQSDGNASKPTADEPYICPFECGKRFSGRHDLDSHIHVRIRSKPIFFECHICRKRFITKDFLQKHAKVHEKDLLGIQANSENDDFEIIEEIETGAYICSENTDVTKTTCPKSDTSETTDEDNSEAEDNTNPTSEISEEDYSSEEENITNDNTEVPGLVEDEVCLDLGENLDNTPIDPLSGISSFEEVPLPQIIKREEETTEPMPRLIDIGEKNMEFIPLQGINTEELILPTPLVVNNIRDRSLKFMPLQKMRREDKVIEQLINTEDFEDLIPSQIVGIREDTTEIIPPKIVEIREDIIEVLPSAIIEGQDEDIELKHVPEQVMSTEEYEGSITNQILNVRRDSMEIMPLERIKREDDNVELIPEAEQIINTEEGIDVIPAKRLKREEDYMNLADAAAVLPSLLENRVLQVRLERLPFFT
ncbi:uncharacterized protein LOC123865890 isoform X2 [Maniola jurtina]|uniref:uncharacterized protein LOC123865890 isoform X2 n=2 Tax=Maniola jurtina TaxID=191418 RepID=UPI001E68E17E|nr:uncharacterized protein LOC123865890 isoform X2 [Maniola jurtina]